MSTASKPGFIPPDELAAAEEYAAEGWTWLGVALRALGVEHVFNIPDWHTHLSAELAEQRNEEAKRAAVVGVSPVEALRAGVRCDGMDGPLPCSKWLGHSGPHYFYKL